MISTGTVARQSAVALFIALLRLLAPPGADGQSLDVLSLDGRHIDPFRVTPASRATVFVFTRTDCPISNRFAPTIEQLRREFEPRGVRFWLVFVDPAEPAAAIRAHLTEYGQQASAVRDPRHTLVEFSGATITPEAAVYVSGDGAARLAYRGRIDDRYVDFGRARPQPLKRDLREALEALLAGRAVVPQTTQAIGCIIADLR
jgi:hypothetical protein